MKRGESVRAYVLNAGPSIWSAFHVIGTVFDRTMVEGTPGKRLRRSTWPRRRAAMSSSRSTRKVPTRS